MSYSFFNTYGNKVFTVTGNIEHRVCCIKTALEHLDRTDPTKAFVAVDFRRDGRGEYIGNCDLSGLDFGKHPLTECYLVDINLSGSKFAGKITYCAFERCDLRGTTFDVTCGATLTTSCNNFAYAKVDATFPAPTAWMVHNGQVVRCCRLCSIRPEGCIGKSHCKTCCKTLYVKCRRCSYHVRVGGDGVINCEFCRGCQNCCQCERDREVFTIHPHKKGDSFDHTRTCGVEWEVNTHTSLMTSWADSCGGVVHSDGSCGYEAVSPPCAGDAIERVLGDLGEALNESGTAADSRCGIHVHVDAADYTWADMYKLLAVYAKIEPMLYIIGGQCRWKSEYAPACGKFFAEALTDDDRKSAVLGVALTNNPFTGKGYGAGSRDMQRGRPGKKGSGRYKGLNILPWLNGRMYRKRDLTPSRKDTTVEFRLHRNTMDAKRVIGWAQLCVCILDWCASHTDKDVQSLPKSALRTLCIIAPELRAWIVGRVLSWRRATSKRITNKSIKQTRTINLKNGVYQCVA